MWPYIFVLFSSCAWIILAGKFNANNRAVYIPLLILVTLASLRHYTVGSDAPSYTIWFRIPVSVDAFTVNKDVELGYQIFLKAMINLYDNYAEYFFTVSLIIILPILLLLRKYSENYLFSYYIYVTFGFYLALFNPVRQMIAVSLCFYATRFILERKVIYYVITVVFASLFHISAWVMLPMYFVCNSNIRVELKCFGAFVTSLMGASIMINYLAADNSRYSNYTEAMTSNGTGLYTVILYISIAIFVYLFGGKLRKSNDVYKVAEQLYLIGVCILAPLILLKTDPSGPQRIISYFYVYLMFVLPCLFKYINNKIIVLIFSIFCFVYYVLIILYFGQIYPYKLNSLFDIM